MDFSSLVIMEKDKENGVIKGELGSYSVLEGTNFVKKLYCVDGEVSLFFDTYKDVLEWEFSAIYDLFNVEALTSLGYIVEEFDEEYNPTWVVKFKFDDEHEEMRAVLNEVCSIIDKQMKKVFEDIKGKEEDYK